MPKIRVGRHKLDSHDLDHGHDYPDHVVTMVMPRNEGEEAHDDRANLGAEE